MNETTTNDYLHDILESNLRIIELLARQAEAMEETLSAVVRTESKLASINGHLGSQQSHEQFLAELLQPIINVVQQK